MLGSASREKIVASAVKTVPVIGWSRAGKNDDGGAMVIDGSSPACTLFMCKDQSVEDNGGWPKCVQGAGARVGSVPVCVFRIMGIYTWFEGRMTIESKASMAASVGSVGIKV